MAFGGGSQATHAVHFGFGSPNLLASAGLAWKRAEHTNQPWPAPNPQHAPKAQDKTPNSTHRWRLPFEVPYILAASAISDGPSAAIVDLD
jgi:hypothetical protein